MERKISVRANREELIQKGILFLDSPIAQPHTISEAGMNIIHLHLYRLDMIVLYLFFYHKSILNRLTVIIMINYVAMIYKRL